MRSKSWKIGVLIFAGAFLVSSIGLIQPNHAEDFQLWTEVKVSHKFKPSKFKLIWGSENRWDRNASRYQTFNTTIGFLYEFLHWLHFGPFYRYEKKRGKAGENRIFPELNFIPLAKPIKIKNRNRFEVRIFPDETRFRWRNRTDLSHKFKTEHVSFTPFVRDEVFIEPNNGGFNENRLDGGVYFGFLKDLINFGLYYRWQHKKSSGVWAENHILGTTLAFKIK